MCLRPLILSLLFLPAFISSVHAQDGLVVATVHGAISEPNRGALVPGYDVILSALGIEFEEANSLDLAALAELEQASATMRGPDWPWARTLSGPRVDAVLAHVGAAPDATIYAMALDGYEVGLSAEDRAEVTWILATHEDGIPLPIGGTGPLWLVPDLGPQPVEEGGSSQWVWSVIAIEVEPRVAE